MIIGRYPINPFQTKVIRIDVYNQSPDVLQWGTTMDLVKVTGRWRVDHVGAQETELFIEIRYLEPPLFGGTTATAFFSEHSIYFGECIENIRVEGPIQDCSQC